MIPVATTEVPERLPVTLPVNAAATVPSPGVKIKSPVGSEEFQLIEPT